MRGEQEVQARVRPGQRFQFLVKFAISQKVSPPAQPSWTTRDARRGERGKVDIMEDVRRSWCHFYVMSPFCFNEWHQCYLCVPVAAAWWCVRWHLTPSVSPDLSPHLTLSNSQPWHWPRCLPSVCFVTRAANQRPVSTCADQSEARISVLSSLWVPGARIMTKLFEQFSGVMSIMPDMISWPLVEHSHAMCGK